MANLIQCDVCGKTQPHHMPIITVSIASHGSGCATGEFAEFHPGINVDCCSRVCVAKALKENA